MFKILAAIFRCFLWFPRLCSRLPWKFREVIRIGATEFLNRVENLNYEFEGNGEKRVLEYLAEKKLLVPDMVFDVGANVGDWTRTFVEIFPGVSRIHLFEPYPPTFEKLEKNQVFCEDNSSVSYKFNPFALGEEKSSSMIRGVEAGDVRAALNEIPKTSWDQKTDFVEYPIEIETGDFYCRTKAIDSISFLKIDVEGFELGVFKGFEKMLSNQKIDFIQFEYGRVNVLNRVTLHSLITFLNQFGYETAKVYPGYLRFGYDEMQWDENWVGPNFIGFSPEKFERIKPDLEGPRRGYLFLPM